MPELKNADDFIVEDEETRALLAALLCRWGDSQAQPIVRQIEDHLNLSIRHGDVRLQTKYDRGVYYKATGKTPSTSFTEIWTAHVDLLNRAGAVFQAAVSQAVKRALDKAIDEVAEASSDAVMKELEDKAKAAEVQRKRKSHRDIKELLGVAKPLGRPEKYTKEYVERRSIEIIRAINAGNRDKGRVAVVFYSAVAHPKSAGRWKLLKMYNDLRTGEQRKELNKFNALLHEKDLIYKHLLAKTTEKPKRRKRKK